MNVHLTPGLEQLVQAKVQSGRYNSASEVVREVLRTIEQRDEVRSIQLHQLRNRMNRPLAESARGEGTDGEELMQDEPLHIDAWSECCRLDRHL